MAQRQHDDTQVRLMLGDKEFESLHKALEENTLVLNKLHERLFIDGECKCHQTRLSDLERFQSVQWAWLVALSTVVGSMFYIAYDAKPQGKDVSRVVDITLPVKENDKLSLARKD